MRTFVFIAVTLACAPAAFAQQWELPGYTALGDDGTIGELSPKGDAFFLKNSNVGWNVRVALGRTTVSVAGTAEPSFIQPKMYVRFKTELTDTGPTKDPVKELEVFTAAGKVVQGFFASSEPNAKPVAKPSAGKYEVRGSVVSLDGSELSVMVGLKRYSFQLADKPKVSVNMADLRYAQPGDKVKLIGWWQRATGPDFENKRAGSCLAEKVTVTAAKPLQPLATVKK